MVRELEFREQMHELRWDYLQKLNSYVGIGTSLEIIQQEMTATQDALARLRAGGYDRIPTRSHGERNAAQALEYRAAVTLREVKQMSSVLKWSEIKAAESEQKEIEFFEAHQAEYYQMAVDWAAKASVRVCVGGQFQPTTQELEAA